MATKSEYWWRPESITSTKLAVLWLTVVGAALRVFALHERGITTDEAITLQFIHIFDAAGLVSQLPQMQPHLPLYYLVLEGWVTLVGPTETLARYPSVFFGAATIPILYAVTTELANREAGFIAAILLTFTPYHIELSQHIRMYALFGFAVTGSWLALIYTLHGRGGCWPGVYLGAAIATVYSHPFGLITAFSQVAIAVLYYRNCWSSNRIRWPRLGAFLGLGMTPAVLWIVWQALRSLTGTRLIVGLELPQGRAPIRMLIQALFGQQTAMILVNRYLWLLIPSTGILLIGITIAYWTSLRPDRARVVADAWFTLPIAGVVLASIVVYPMLRPRYLIGGILGGYVLLAIVLANYRPRRLRHLLTAGILVAVIVSVPGGYADTGQIGWGEASEYVSAEAEPDDRIVMIGGLSKERAFHARRSGLEVDISVRSEREVSLAPTSDVWVIRRVYPEGQSLQPSHLGLPDSAWTIECRAFNRVEACLFQRSNGGPGLQQSDDIF